jgi:hypothetical protein
MTSKATFRDPLEVEAAVRRVLMETPPAEPDGKSKRKRKATATNGDAGQAGRTEPPPQAEPPPDAEPVSGAQLLADMEQYVRRYLVLPAVAYLVISVWIIATHAVQSFDCFAYLAVLSPQKRCGKSRLFEVIAELAHRPWYGTAPSPAALYRMLDDIRTLLIDETEIFRAKHPSEATQVILAVLNSGHRKGLTVPRCEAGGHVVREFPVFGPKAFAAIGKLPDTLVDRSIAIRMQRKAKNQKVTRFRMARAKQEAAPIKSAAARFVAAHRSEIEQNYSRVLDLDMEYLNDRDADFWASLFAVCITCDPARIAELKKCAIALSGSKAKDDADNSFSLKLLADIRTVWPRDERAKERGFIAEKCFTADLISRLEQMEDSLWSGPDYRLSPRKLATMLKPYDVEPKLVRIGNDTSRGYEWKTLEDVFARYLDDQTQQSAAHGVED